MDEPKNIIIRMPNWIGDFVLALAALQSIRQRFSGASITVMCQSPLQELLKEDPRVDEILVFSKESLKFSRREARKNIVEMLRRGNYDLGILLTNSFSSAWYFWQAGIQERVGYRDHFRSLLLTKGKSKKKHDHQATAYLRLLEDYGAPMKGLHPKIYLKPSEEQEARDLLKEQGYLDGQYLIGINAFAAYGQAKCWPKKKFRKCAEKLLKNKDIFLVFVGDKQAQEEAEEITQGLGSRALNWAGKTSLRQLCSLISLCDLFLTNDSGPMHIAAALERELIAIFGSTSSKKTGPFGKGEVIEKSVPCSPCYRRVCPIDFRCMEAISVQEVYSMIEEKRERYVENMGQKTSP
ncbi:MAG: lipopolysaccharide heptosyltransferase II [Chlamydiota bacterium]